MNIQQGDIILTKCELPTDATELAGNILHQGDNHAHTVSGEFKLLKSGNDIFLRVNSECVLEHCEHGVCDQKYRTLQCGVYKKSIVLEYDHFLEESRAVID